MKNNYSKKAELTRQNEELSQVIVWKDEEIEQLRKENEELKKQSKQLAVEKLEELKERFVNCKNMYFDESKLNKHEQEIVNDGWYYAKYVFGYQINEMINELKGEKDE